MLLSVYWNLYRGSARIISEKDTLELQEGDLFYIPKGCKYHSYWYGQEGALFDSFAFSAIPQKESISYCLQKLTTTEEVKILHKQLAEDRTVNPHTVGLLYQLLWILIPTIRHHTYGQSGALARKIAAIKAKISSLGFEIAESEPLKIVIKAGKSLADHLRREGIECEFSDSEYTVLMLTPENSDSDLDRLICG